MKSQLLSAFFALAVVGILTPGLLADEEQRQVKVVIADDGDAETIEIDDLDLEVGESRQILTDSGKEIVFTQTEDGLNITVDGEDIDIPAMHGAHGAHKIVERIVSAHGGEEGHNAHRMVFVTSDGDAEVETNVHKIVVGSGGANHVFISEDGEATEVEGHHVMKWTGHSPVVQISGQGLSEHLEESGALDGLSDEQRQKILDALNSYKSTSSASGVMVIELDDDSEGEQH